MNSKTASIIDAKDLLEIYKNQPVIIVDASKKEIYKKKHLDQAVFVDLDAQLSNIKENVALGGRHPLPEINEFLKLLGNLGISKKNHVVVYDNNNGANAAARFWWMLKSVGHKKVQVLNGGIQQAEKIGFPINNKKPTKAMISSDNYDVRHWKLPLTNMNEVEEVSQKENYVVIDVREHSRYIGEYEPIDLIAGHIPGAINIPFASNLNNNGLFLSPKELKKKYQNIANNIPSTNIIVHCGSGVTACHTLLAFDYAELDIPKLYVGSWSEWSRNQKEIETSI